MTVGTVATALAAAIISLSSANLGAIGAVASGSTTIFSPDPSMNLHVSIYRFSIAKKKKKTIHTTSAISNVVDLWLLIACSLYNH